MADLPSSDPYHELKRGLATTPIYLRLGIVFIKTHLFKLIMTSLILLGSVHFLAYLRGVPKPQGFEDFGHPILILTLLVQLFFLVWLTLLVDMTVKGAQLPLRVVTTYAISRFPHAFLVTILAVGVSAAGLFLFLIPGLIAAFFLQYSVVVASIRGQTSMVALRYSIHVVKAAWNHILPLFFIFNFLVPGLLMLPAEGLLTAIGLESAEYRLCRSIVSDMMAIPGNVLWLLLFLNVESQIDAFDE